ncbi:MAG: alpha/beta fold hydrolase [Candidatus Aminicenantes bacterium]|nr:alpha/beta fold hydrolase [Candidatus Aminicenantes bacterium]NIM82102.1 alpha/beta fold hydrolase [Candidatus Aminicenantes bacterium]NIN21496.1 alpha/beta fold hydrolase [Candidatus Aminicenantes bacterium]NIN45308.1 alpha/beta fold hydrolase [Candidatus Aminicenantes bacterium]NIN88125.1 alpha/beta fold hydrolase [Candidatus Aminicenantes bacterium]
MNRSTENYLKLSDGRQLCYAEYGDPAGQPIFVFHGNPNSRLLWGVIPGSPFLTNVRLIAPDRPGFGQTDFVEGVTTIENWPNDIVALADSLGIDKFAVFAPSGGGPFALACAWKIPERLTSVGIFASVGPFIPETDKNIAAPIRMMWTKAPKWPGLFKLQMKMFAWLARTYPKLYIKMVLKEFSKTDREVYERLNIAGFIRPDRNEGYRQGGIGTWYDAMIPGNWAIPLNEIKARVYLWQGEEDISVPPSMGHYMAEKIPNCEAEFIKGAGHFWIFEHLPEMLEKLVKGD